ncbi:MAG: ATP-dependent helicase HrpB [Glaciecola sp.]
MLPIEQVSEQVCASIVEQDCILVAPPGAGKSTFLPLQLLALPEFANKRIIMLQPRQVAARNVARYLAQQLKEPLGQTVGYQIRGESIYGPQTRLLIMTEGLLSARMQSDPELTNVALIIFDEFHERSVHADIACGLALEIQQGLREDLRILVMSATLSVEGVSKLMPHAKHVSCEGRSYPIDYHYRPITRVQHGSDFQKTQQFRQHICTVVQEAWTNNNGNILVFLAGSADISALSHLLEQLALPNTIIAPLIGHLSAKQQQQAIATPPVNYRKIVLATNIAETSLTIDGVNIVVDSGREKVQKYQLARKSNMVIEQHISQASSIQRAGRAGRLRAGVCYRVWEKSQQDRMIKQPEVALTQVDISRELLLLLDWGTSFSQLPLIDPPSNAQINAAYSLLVSLEMVSEAHKITALGKAAVVYACHPRLAKLLVLAQTRYRQHAYMVAVLVAILEGKSLHKEAGSIDIDEQIRYLLAHKQHPLHQDISRWCKQLNVRSRTLCIDDLPQLLLLSHNDLIAKRRDNGSFTLANGTGAKFHDIAQAHYGHHEWLFCLQASVLAHQSENATIRLFAPLPQSNVQQLCTQLSQQHQTMFWDKSAAKVACKEYTSVGAIVIEQRVVDAPIDQESIALLVEQAQSLVPNILPEAAQSYLQRLTLASHQLSHLNLPVLHYKQFFDNWQQWLLPFIQDKLSIKALQQLDWLAIIKSRLDYQQQLSVDTHFPTHFVAPTGNKHKFIYANKSISLAIRLQELYGIKQNISVGNIPVTLSLLSPAHREIQKTSDLVGFWQGSYVEVQKEMKGRYPKHFWPDDPANAAPTTKTKKRM